MAEDAASRLFPVGQMIDVVALIFLAVVLLANAKGFKEITAGLSDTLGATLKIVGT